MKTLTVSLLTEEGGGRYNSTRRNSSDLHVIDTSISSNDENEGLLLILGFKESRTITATPPPDLDVRGLDITLYPCGREIANHTFI